MKLLVIGGSGLVGANLVEIASEAGVDVHATYNSTDTTHTDSHLDKSDPEHTMATVEEFDPDVVVDTAAFHDVDACNIDRLHAWAVNATGSRNAAIAANSVGAHFIYLSTDYVFRGDPADTPYSEDEPVWPLNYYGRTKYAGEQAAQLADMATVLRPSVIYGLNGENFVTWALGELQDGKELNIVDDQVSSPTYAPDLARACLAVANRKLTGVYHAAGPERLSRYEFTQTLAEVCGYDPELVSPISTAELGQEAPRPRDSSLDSAVLYDAIDYSFRGPVSAFDDIRSVEGE